MTDPVHFQPNEPKVIHESYDDEVVIVNLDSGNYYSVEKVGADIWAQILSGASRGDIVDNLVQQYPESEEDVAGAVEAFIDELVQEDLIVPTEPSPKRCSNGHAVDNSWASTASQFEAPTLRTFTDMQDLLLLDPIHEVDDMGWPNATP